MFDIVEFWITNNGAPIFWYSPNKNLNPDAKNEFITQIFHHVKELEKGAEVIHEEQMGVFEVEGNYYYYLGSPGINCIFIAKSPKKFNPISIYFDLCQVEKYFTPIFVKEFNILKKDKSKAISFVKDLKDKFENSFFKEYFKNNLQ
ncbi:MAG: hypothetical protein ACFFAO_11225 [Candidatus Hermodarchaeota archaeon]